MFLSHSPLPKNRKHIFSNVENDKPFPPQSYHVRASERKVNDEYFETIAALEGAGLSLPKAMEAFVLVSNLYFGRDFKLPNANQTCFDIDTLPDSKNNRFISQSKLREEFVVCVV